MTAWNGLKLRPEMKTHSLLHMDLIITRELSYYLLSSFSTKDPVPDGILTLLETDAKKGYWPKCWSNNKNPQILPNQAEIQAILP